MSIIKRRGRIVSFRVSEEEYLNLCQATDASGARSISDFARHITCHHSLVLATAAGPANGNGSRNDHALASIVAASASGFSSSPSMNGGVELHPAPAMALEVSRLRERLDEISRQMQVLTRRVSRSI